MKLISSSPEKDLKEVVMVKDSQSDTHVIEHQDLTMTCLDCSVTDQHENLSAPQMLDHLTLVHMQGKGHKVWPGETGNGGLKYVGIRAEHARSKMKEAASA